MNQTYERTFSIDQASPEPSYSYSNAASITKVVLSWSTTHQSGQSSDRIIPLGVMENEQIADAYSDMDMLAQQSIHDL